MNHELLTGVVTLMSIITHTCKSNARTGKCRQVLSRIEFSWDAALRNYVIAFPDAEDDAPVQGLSRRALVLERTIQVRGETKSDHPSLAT